MSHTEAFDDLLGEQPSDWAFFEVYVTLDDARRLSDARVSLARANARPTYGPGDHDFAITVANTHGHGARAGVVRSALRTLDDRGITGRTWGGATRTLTRPAPPHRYGPQGPGVGLMLRDEGDLQLLAELAGVLDQTVSDAGLSAGSYLILRELVSDPAPHPVTGLAARLGAEPEELTNLCSRLIDLRLAEARPTGVAVTERGVERAAKVEADANEAMREYVLSRPHTATVYGLVASMQGGRFTVEDLLGFLAEGPTSGDEGAA